MRFLLDANMPRRSAAEVRRAGHECSDVRDLHLGGAADSEIAAYAIAHSMALITRDGDFADVRNYPPELYHGMVVLELPDHATASMVVATLSAFLHDERLLNLLPGRLAVVQPGRIRLRPA